jgi:hypothetical protein
MKYKSFDEYWVSVGCVYQSGFSDRDVARRAWEASERAAQESAGNLKDLLKRSFTELVNLSEGESCDHSVNICWCSTFQLMQEIQDALKAATNKVFNFDWRAFGWGLGAGCTLDLMIFLIFRLF